MCVVIVKNEYRIAIRIVSTGMAPVECTAADDESQQRREHSAHGSSLSDAEPHGSDSSHCDEKVSITHAHGCRFVTKPKCV